MQLLLLALTMSMAFSALAANERRRKVTEYQDVSEEDRAAARERARNRMTSWRETQIPEEYHFPWMQIGFVGAAFLLATPFAWGAYKRSSKELKSADAFAAKAPSKRPRPPAPEGERERT